jgi:DNA-binding transcriptional LysR family regulator
MHIEHISKIDLNLLVVLLALLEAGSVTGAARTLGMTQPSVSRALARLRDVFGDELFVRRGRGVMPTRLARELGAALGRHLGELDQLIGDRGSFDPVRSRRRFRIVAFDYPQVALLGPLVRELAHKAPDVDLEIRQPSRANDDELEAGTIDLFLGPRHASGTGIVWSALFDDSYVCIVDASDRRALDLARYTAMGHVLVAPRELPSAVVDEVLARRRLQRRVAIQVPTFFVVPDAILGTPYVATVPRRLARSFCASHSLRSVAPPLAIPGFTICQAWHEVHRDDPGHRWLRAEVSRAATVLKSSTPDRR